MAVFQRGQKISCKTDLNIEISGVYPQGQPIVFSQSGEKMLNVNINGVSQQCKQAFLEALIGDKSNAKPN